MVMDQLLPLHLVEGRCIRLTVWITGLQHTPRHLQQTAAHRYVGFLPAHFLYPAVELPSHNTVFCPHGPQRGLPQCTAQKLIRLLYPTALALTRRAIVTRATPSPTA